MSEHPWEFESLALSQHDQPCDCAICDEIHFQREVRKKRMKDFEAQDVNRQMQPLRERDSVIADLKKECKRLTSQLTAMIADRNDLRQAVEKQHQQIIDLGNEINRLMHELGRYYEDGRKMQLELYEQREQAAIYKDQRDDWEYEAKRLRETLHKFACFDEFIKAWTARPEIKSKAINHVPVGA